MKKWLQKTLVFSVALLTFGFITPDHTIWDALENGQDSNRTPSSNVKKVDASENTIEDTAVEEIEESEEPLDPVHSIVQAAKEQSYIKFGTKIAPVIEDEFENRIFPNMERVITATLANLDEESKKYLTITEKPSGNYSEKIFHIADGISGKDLIRFHVRTEKRPLEGYFYNFHYHTYEDDFASHHTIGDIYCPPKSRSG